MKSKLTAEQAQFFFNQMSAFNFGFMQDVRTFMRSLKNKDFSLDFAIACIEFRQGKTNEVREQDKKDEKIWLKNAKRCPDCGKILSLNQIKEPEGLGNVKGYKSIWHCTNGWQYDDPEKWCGYHSYSMLTMNQIFKHMGIKIRVKER